MRGWKECKDERRGWTPQCLDFCLVIEELYAPPQVCLQQRQWWPRGWDLLLTCSFQTWEQRYSRSSGHNYDTTKTLEFWTRKPHVHKKFWLLCYCGWVRLCCLTGLSKFASNPCVPAKNSPLIRIGWDWFCRFLPTSITQKVKWKVNSSHMIFQWCRNCIRCPSYTLQTFLLVFWPE